MLCGKFFASALLALSAGTWANLTAVEEREQPFNRLNMEDVDEGVARLEEAFDASFILVCSIFVFCECSAQQHALRVYIPLQSHFHVLRFAAVVVQQQ